MKKFFVISFVILLFVSCSYAQDNSITFSPLDMLNQESQNNSSGILSSVLEGYNPEDFITASITGSPEVVRDKANTFRVNAGIEFNTEMYYSKFVPEITSALDKLSDMSRKNSGNLVELYDNGTFGPKYYAFNSDNTQRVSELLSKFRMRALRVKGIVIELQDSGMRTIHRINRQIPIQYFIFETSEGNNKSLWRISPVIINFTDNKRTVDAKLVLPVEFEIPASILPSVKNMKASLLTDLIGGTETSRRQGWFGAGVINVTSEHAKSLRLPTTEGAMINRVAEGGAAEKAGLRQGDVILMLNAERVINAESFANKIGTFYEGDSVVMIVNRYGRSYNLRITLGARPK